MNKKIVKIFILFILLFFNLKNVQAITCAQIDEKVNSYNAYDERLKQTDCSDTSDENIVSVCNNNKMHKNIIVTELMKLKDEGKLCGSNQSSVNKIIEENEDNCGQIFSDEFTDFVNKIMLIFYIVAPILLIVFGTLDYTKATLNNDGELLKRANKRFVRRLVATILLFLSPLITNFIISFNVSDYYLSGNAYVCNYNYIIFNKKVNIKFVPKRSSNSTEGTYDSILDAAYALHYAQTDWVYTLNFPPLTSGDIDTAIDNPNKGTCCATYVSSVLYKAGLFTAEEINGINYNYSPDLANFLESSGWTKIENYSDLSAGDIVFMTSSSSGGGIGHVQIYAGDGTWYNAGSQESIKSQNQPYASDASARFLFAMRQ